MELNEKLQELRKAKGFTQEQLAEALFVSRTAVSKWESGRGYPSIDSLKALARFFAVSVDDLLSGEEVLEVAREDHKQRDAQFRDLVFALMDMSAALFLVLPLFGRNDGGYVYAVSLLALRGIGTWLRAAYLAVVLGMACWGVLALCLRACQSMLWENQRGVVSVILNGTGTLVFIISRQPYAAAILFIYLVIKALLMAKRP